MEIYIITGIILVPFYLFSLIASLAVNSTFKKYGSQYCQKGINAFRMTRYLLNKNQLDYIQVVRVRGTLSDYYDNKNQQLALSDSVIESSSVSALGVAAHEVGHAVQYKENYLPIKIRAALVPVLNISNTLLWPLVAVGLILGFVNPETMLGNIFIYIGIGFFGLSVLFQLITLPAEINASKRARQMLYDEGILTKEELANARKVLNAAAMTYIAAFAVSVVSLLRFVLYIFLRTRKR